MATSLPAGVLFSGPFRYLRLEPPTSLLFPELDNVLGLIQPHNLTHTGINHTGITSQLMSNRDDSSFYLL